MANKTTPLRMCVGCREMKSKRELLRVVKTPQDEIVLDATGKLAGRGAYVCANAECLQKAVKTKGLERSLKVKIDSAVVEQLLLKIGDANA